MFPGPVLSYRAFKQSATPKAIRTITQVEYDTAIAQLSPTYGITVTTRVARTPRPTNLFVKKAPTSFEFWPTNNIISQENYEEKYQRPCHAAITANLRQFLVNQRFLSEEQIN